MEVTILTVFKCILSDIKYITLQCIFASIPEHV